MADDKKNPGFIDRQSARFGLPGSIWADAKAILGLEDTTDEEIKQYEELTGEKYVPEEEQFVLSAAEQEQVRKSQSDIGTNLARGVKDTFTGVANLPFEAMHGLEVSRQQGLTQGAKEGAPYTGAVKQMAADTGSALWDVAKESAASFKDTFSPKIVEQIENDPLSTITNVLAVGKILGAAKGAARAGAAAKTAARTSALDAADVAWAESGTAVTDAAIKAAEEAAKSARNKALVKALPQLATSTFEEVTGLPIGVPLPGASSAFVRQGAREGSGLGALAAQQSKRLVRALPDPVARAGQNFINSEIGVPQVALDAERESGLLARNVVDGLGEIESPEEAKKLIDRIKNISILQHLTMKSDDNLLKYTEGTPTPEQLAAFKKSGFIDVSNLTFGKQALMSYPEGSKAFMDAPSARYFQSASDSFATLDDTKFGGQAQKALQSIRSKYYGPAKILWNTKGYVNNGLGVVFLALKDDGAYGLLKTAGPGMATAVKHALPKFKSRILDKITYDDRVVKYAQDLGLMDNVDLPTKQEVLSLTSAAKKEPGNLGNALAQVISKGWEKINKPLGSAYNIFDAAIKSTAVHSALEDEAKMRGMELGAFMDSGLPKDPEVIKSVYTRVQRVMPNYVANPIWLKALDKNMVLPMQNYTAANVRTAASTIPSKVGRMSRQLEEDRTAEEQLLQAFTPSYLGDKAFVNAKDKTYRATKGSSPLPTQDIFDLLPIVPFVRGGTNMVESRVRRPSGGLDWLPNNPIRQAISAAQGLDPQTEEPLSGEFSEKLAKGIGPFLPTAIQQLLSTKMKVPTTSSTARETEKINRGMDPSSLVGPGGWTGLAEQPFIPADAGAISMQKLIPLKQKIDEIEKQQSKRIAAAALLPTKEQRKAASKEAASYRADELKQTMKIYSSEVAKANKRERALKKALKK